ncbi:MAG: DNA polymerase III subunit gamma/tau [Bacilli bacterium]
MYQSLYRKYRPDTFERIVGQNFIVKILKNSIINNKISHAYLFSGPRGTGKTTTAKVFAKTVNCLNMKDGVSCEQCSNCLEINNNNAVDIIEIDAASNNGVDEIRELRNNIKLACSSLKYKVYIIDEVHMLSTGAFNALLKTLEEPPQHIIFILATTDPQKVPLTIKSRCQCYNFTQISIEDIVSNLKYIASQEKIMVDDKILYKIATYCNGGMRDAIGMLEKVSLFGNNITIEDFDKLCGFVSNEDIENFTSDLFENNIENVVNIIDKKYLTGINLSVFFSQIIDYLRECLINDIEDKKKIRNIVRYIEVLNEVCNVLKTSTNPRGISIALIAKEMLNKDEFNNTTKEKKLNENNIFTDTSSLNKNKVSVDKDSMKKVDNNNKVEKSENKKTNTVIVHNDIIINNTFATASKSKLNDFKNMWSKLNEFVLDSNYGSNVSFLLDAEICAVGDKYVILSFMYESLVNRALQLYDELIKSIEKLLGIEIYIAFVTKKQWQKEKTEYIKKTKEGYTYKLQDDSSIIEREEKKNSSANEVQADIIFGRDIVEYE